MASGSAPGRTPVIQFGEFTVDISRRTLSRSGIRLKLQRQPFQVLELLVLRSPAAVSREEIRRHVWGDDINVDTEQSINYCIRQIRSVLEDNASTPRFIETLPREGYRFKAIVEGLPFQDGPVDSVETASQPRAEESRPVEAVRRRRVTAGMTVAAILSIVLIACVWIWLANRPVIPSVTQVSYVTNYAGNEREPSFSPDGRQIAFSWDGETGDNRDIYITLVGEQHPIRLTNDPALDAFPAWSPDGKHIAFVRFRNDFEADLMLIPALGGSERVLYSIRLGYEIGGTRYEISGSHRMLAWSPDGKQLAFTNEVDHSGHYALFLLSLDSGVVRPLLRNQMDGIGDTAPAFSADSHWLAYVHLDQTHISRIFLQRLSSDLQPEGSPQVVRGAGRFPLAPVWAGNGKRLFFVDRSKILAAEVGGMARPVYATGSRLDGLTIGGPEPRLVTAIAQDDSDLWIMALHESGLVPGGAPRHILPSTANEVYPRFSPDGRNLAFLSNRSGHPELWVADENGGNPRQLTHLSVDSGGQPNWSPDGKSVAWWARIPDEPQIYVIRLQDGTARQLTRDKLLYFDPSWSEDGRTIYVQGVKPGSSSIFSLPAEGGIPQRLWRVDPVVFPVEVPGRHLLVYSKEDQFGLFAHSLVGDAAKNPELRLAEDYLPPMGGICPFNDGIYYVGYSSDGLPKAFRFYSFESRKSVDIAPAPPNLQLGLAVSPDRTKLVYAVEKQGAQDLIQLELDRN